MRKKIKRGQLPAEQWAARAAELRPIFAAELSGLNDSAAATALNARKVLAPAGGQWQAVQVGRVRERLELDKEQDANELRFREIRADLIKHFGRAPAPPRDDLVVNFAAMSGYIVDRYNRLHRQRANILKFNRVHPNQARAVAALPADVWRQYQRDRALLDIAIELAQVASDAFAIAARKSLLAEILETSAGIAAELELAQKPALAADTEAAGSA